MLAKDFGSYMDDRVKTETAVELIKVLAGLRMERARAEAGAEKPAAGQADDKPKEDS